MSEREAKIKIPVDLTNPGQFFACCGLLELADRLWPGTEGWFESINQFMLSTGGRATSTEPLFKKIIESTLEPLFPEDQFNQLNQLNKCKTDRKTQNKSLSKAEETTRKQLNSERIASGFHLGSPFNLRIDWWLAENCDGDHLKTWAGQQAITGVADAMKAALCVAVDDGIFEMEKVFYRQGDGEGVAGSVTFRL
jgi:CRISPR-associated protein Csb3